MTAELPHCTGCRCGRCLVQPTTAAAAPGAGWAYRPGANPFARVEQLSARVWLVVEDDRFCEHPFMYVVLGDRRTVVIDTGVGTASYGDWLAGWLQKRGPEVAARPLLVVNTHCHFDHVGSNASLAPRAEALAASGADTEFTTAAFDEARDASLARQVGCAVAPFEVTRWLAHGERIAVGADEDDDLEVLHTPGHTPDSLCLWLRRERLLFVGDTLYPHATIILANRDSDLSQYAASLRVLGRFLEEHAGGAADVKLACGHVDAGLPASAIAEVAQLVEDATSGRLRASAPAPGSERAVAFERGLFCVTVRRDDPAVGL